MVKLCSMASLVSPSGFVLHQEQGMGRVIKDSVHLPTSGIGHDITRSSSFNLMPHQFEEPWKPITGLFESNKFIEIDSLVKKPMLIDMQAKETGPSSLLFSYGIAEKCTRHSKILQYLTSGASEVESEGLDLSLLSELMGFQMSSSNEHQLQFVDFIGDVAVDSKVVVQPDGRVLFTGNGNEVKDLISVITEFYSSKDLTMCKKHSLLVPYFNRFDGGEAQAVADLSSLKLEALTVAPLKSPEKVKFNESHKKKNGRKQSKGRDLYKKNTFHACESLLSLMVDKRRRPKSTIDSLKKSGPELPELLTQFSAGIAGTGLAVLFSVVCRVALGTVPLCGTKVLSTGFGFGLVWLASAVNRLRDTIVRVCKNSNRAGLKEEEMMKRVDSTVKDIYFRAATVMAFAFLRLA